MPYADKAKQAACEKLWRQRHPERVKAWSRGQTARRQAARKAERARAIESAARMLEKAERLAREALGGRAK